MHVGNSTRLGYLLVLAGRGGSGGGGGADGRRKGKMPASAAGSPLHHVSLASLEGERQGRGSCTGCYDTI